MSGHSGSGVYSRIGVALCVLTGISWAADEMKSLFQSHALLAVIVLAVATLKAGCVMLWFMHLKYEKAWKYVLLLPTTILALGLPLALAPDIAFHYYSPDVPQNPLSESSNIDGSTRDPGMSH